MASSGGGSGDAVRDVFVHACDHTWAGIVCVRHSDSTSGFTNPQH